MSTAVIWPSGLLLGKQLAAKHQDQLIEPGRVDVANSLCIERVAQVDAADFGAYVPPAATH
jgi:hypothetical protein